MTIHAVLTLLRYHWKALVVCTLLGALAGYGLASLRPQEYTAEAQVFVSVADSRTSTDIAQGATYAQDQARNFAALAQTQVVLEPVANNLPGDVSIKQVRGKINMTVPLNTSIISIKATDTSPRRAAEIANGVSASLATSVTKVAPKLDTGATPVRLTSVEQASVPTVPSSPVFALYVVIGGLLGLALAAVGLGLNDFLRARVRSPEHASELVGAPVIGVISLEKGLPRRAMVATAAKHSVRAEQYRQIRTNLRFLQMDQGRKMFVVTSTMPGEAKSTTAANLAATIAAEGSRVCLVEADLRKPTIGNLLDLENDIGLTTVLAGYAELDDVLQPWGPDGLQVLLSGELPPNPSELLGSRRAEELFRSVRERFDVTIIDCPPVLPVTDATILSRMFGGVLMVVLRGHGRGHVTYAARSTGSPSASGRCWVRSSPCRVRRSGRTSTTAPTTPTTPTRSPAPPTP